MNKSKIEWTDYTWNPITGCLHNCPYCYARRQAKRFCGDVRLNLNDSRANKVGENIWEIEEKWQVRNGRTLVYPLGFHPTFHKYRLDWPKQVVTGSRVFVCSMADMFGEWVPDAWIEQIFEACEDASQHQYLFLTKNPKRYIELDQKGILRNNDNFWYGTTITSQTMPFFYSDKYNTFLSIEPIAEPFDKIKVVQSLLSADWIIIGAETGNRKGKPVPQLSWFSEILNAASESNIPVFMKDSLVNIVGENNMLRLIPEAMKKTVYSEGTEKKLFSNCGICREINRKSDMHTILSKRRRTESAKVIGYVCEKCYSNFERSLK